ncbi:hypothetical protein ACFYPZ_09900 [Streptomyces sp. NPDC005506]|uniref:hypothetical protein n=1 Tax=Streptomyces sp. NPDC005506 TaxID=3364718 RepID=UPI003699A1BE
MLPTALLLLLPGEARHDEARQAAALLLLLPTALLLLLPGEARQAGGRGRHSGWG